MKGIGHQNEVLHVVLPPKDYGFHPLGTSGSPQMVVKQDRLFSSHIRYLDAGSRKRLQIC